MSQRRFTRRASKIRPVPIDQMVVPTALHIQRPFIPSHGDMLAQSLDLNMLGFPVVNWRDGKYWLCDGQHRVYALKKNGFEHDVVDCEVYENLTDEEMAQVFLGRDRRKAITPFVKFHLACTAGYVRESAIRRVVEANGLKVSRDRSERCISAVGALIKIYDTSPNHDTAIGWVVRVGRDAFNGDPLGLDGVVLEALGLVYNRYNGKTLEKRLVENLAAMPHGIRGLMRKAEALREKTGNYKTACVASCVVDVYNARGKGPRLSAWWKDTHATQAA